MVIKRSSAPEVAALLDDLEHGDETARQAAAARLAIIGTRAVEGLLRLLEAGSAPPAVRAAALSGLEGTGDPRALEAAFTALEDADHEVSFAAAGVLKVLLDSPRGTEVLDRLTLVALDRSRVANTRLGAIEALRAVSPGVTAPLWERLGKDENPVIREAVAEVSPGTKAGSPGDPAGALTAAAAGGELPPPNLLARWLQTGGTETPLPVLHRLVQALREREGAADEGARAAWLSARAAAHLAIAEHGSTVALYDLRETIEGGEPVPGGMLAAMAKVGDRSCLEPLAAAYAKSATSGESGWRERLFGTFRAIAERERITARHAEAKRIRSRWPAEADVLLPRR